MISPSLDDSLRMADQFARSSASRHGMHMLDDLLSELRIRAWTAHRSWEPGDGQSLQNWVLDNLRYGVSDVRRTHAHGRRQYEREFHRRNKIISFEIACEIASGGGDDWAVPFDSECDVVDRECVRTILGELSAESREVITRRYQDGETRASVARSMGMTVDRVRIIEVRSVAAFRGVARRMGVLDDWEAGPVLHHDAGDGCGEHSEDTASEAVSVDPVGADAD